MADYDEVMTQAEYDAKYGAADGSAFDAVMSAEEYKNTYGSDWNIVGSLKNFGSGVVEGATGLAGLAADLNPFNLTGPRFDFPTSKAIAKVNDAILSPKDPKYRYARTIGQFSVPVPGAGVKGVVSGVLAGIGAQGAEDVTGDTKIAPILGALAGGSLPSLISDLWSAGRSIFRGATPQEIKGTAAKTFQDITALTPSEIEDAIIASPRDQLSRLASTAELTDNAGAAQLEKTLASSDEAARFYAERAKAREGLRNQIIGSTSSVKGVNKEALGASLIDRAKQVDEFLSQNARNLWEKVPREAPVDIADLQTNINSIVKQKKAGLGLNARVKELVEQILPKATDDVATAGLQSSGALQDIRSDSLRLMRDATLTGQDERVLGALQAGIDDAMGKSLLGEDYEIWKAARGATALNKEIFRRGTAGGTLISETARPATVLKSALKGDAKAVRELKASLGGDKKLLEEVKTGVLDLIPRDAQGNLTANNMKKFISANEGGLKELFGQDHFESMKRVLTDLQSEARVGDLAFKASKGGSNTAQRQTVAGAIEDSMLGNLVGGSSMLGRIAESVKGTARIKDAKGVQELLFRAAMEPKFAIELAKAPTNVRIFNALDRLKAIGNNLLNSSAVSIGKELSRTQDNRKSSPSVGVFVTSPKKKVIEEPTKENISMTDGPNDLNPVIDAMIQQESSRNPNAVSNKGAIGLMQIMPATAKDIAKKLGVESYDLKDPETNKRFGTYYIKELLGRFDGDMGLALTAYHSGPERVAKLLKATGGNKLEDIIEYLGPIGKKYAKQVMNRINLKEA